jgi:hypothetical protein
MDNTGGADETQPPGAAGRLVVALTGRGGVGRPGCGESSSRKAEPFGTCSEPSNVQAGGNACPYRFRCAGCDHFRTDGTDCSVVTDVEGVSPQMVDSRRHKRT